MSGTSSPARLLIGAVTPPGRSVAGPLPVSQACSMAIAIRNKRRFAPIPIVAIHRDSDLLASIWKTF